MKKIVMSLLGIAGIMVLSCQQEKNYELSSVYDLKIAVDENNIDVNDDNYLYLTIENTLDKPVVFPEGRIILEFTSYSGAIQRTVALNKDLIEVDNEWTAIQNYTLQPGEKLNLRSDLIKIIYGGNGNEPLDIPKEDSYAINAFITQEQNMESLPQARKLRSNYLYIDLESSQKVLSLVD